MDDETAKNIARIQAEIAANIEKALLQGQQPITVASVKEMLTRSAAGYGQIDFYDHFELVAGEEPHSVILRAKTLTGLRLLNPHLEIMVSEVEK